MPKWRKIANVGGTWRGDSGESRGLRSRLVRGFGLIFALGLALIGPARAEMVDTEVYWGPGTDLEAIDVGEIDKAETSIDMFAYVLTDRAIVDALRDAGARGVKVRIWRDAEMARKTADYDVAAQLGAGAAGIEVRIKPPGELMHLKAYCVDGRTLRTGGSNFSRSGETRQDNDLEIIRSASACAAFEAKFQEAWGK